MAKKIILPLNVLVEPTSDCFLWSIHGLRPHYMESIRLYSEEISKFDYGVSLVTKDCFSPKDSGHFQHKEYSIIFSRLFGRTIEQMFREETIVYTPGRKPSAPEYLSFEVDGNTVSVLETPQQFGIFHPSESITMESLEAAVIQFCRDFCGVPFAKVQLSGKVEKITYQDSLASYNKQLERERMYEEMKARGENLTIKITGNALTKDMGEEKISELGEVDYWYIDEKGGFRVKLKDGSNRLIRRPPLEAVK